MSSQLNPESVYFFLQREHPSRKARSVLAQDVNLWFKLVMLNSLCSPADPLSHEGPASRAYWEGPHPLFSVLPPSSYFWARCPELTFWLWNYKLSSQLCGLGHVTHCWVRRHEGKARGAAGMFSSQFIHVEQTFLFCLWHGSHTRTMEMEPCGELPKRVCLHWGWQRHAEP